VLKHYPKCLRIFAQVGLPLVRTIRILHTAVYKTPRDFSFWLAGTATSPTSGLCTLGRRNRGQLQVPPQHGQLDMRPLRPVRNPDSLKWSPRLGRTIEEVLPLIYSKIGSYLRRSLDGERTSNVK
jgi:hypothetical protein